MAGNKNNISSKQLMSFIISSQIGLGILTLPSILAEKVGHDGWITIILSGLVVILLLLPIVKLLKKFANKSILEINILLYGKIIGMLFNLIFISYLMFSASVGSRLFVELINIIVLKETPKLVIAVLIFSPTLYFAVKGLKVICRFANLLYLAHILMLVTFLFIAKEIRITYLMPVANSGVLKIIANMPYVSYSFLGFELAVIFYPNVTNKEHTMRHLITGVIYTTIFFTIITAFSLLLFGEEKLKMLVFPIFNIEQAIRFPVIERLDLFFIIFWFPTMASSVRTYFFSTYYCALKLFKSKREKLFSMIIFGTILIVSRIPPDFESLYTYMNYSAIFGAVNIGIILLSFFVSNIKKEALNI